MSLGPTVVPFNASSTGPVTAPRYRLVYFNAQGKGEVIRYLFALAHEPFIDQRVPESAGASSRPTFDALKGGLPFGQLPVLQVDGEGGPLLAQSRAIERFLARRFRLMGGSDVEEQLVDSVIEALRDLTQSYARSRADAEAQTQFRTQTLPTFLQQLTRLAQRSSSAAGQKTLVGHSLTLADIAVYQIFSVATPDSVAVNQVIDGYPLIRAVITHVANQPEIQKWIAARPA